MSLSEREKQRTVEHAEAQRNRILDAAERCFIDSGFHAASMSRIAETAEISQGLAYRYFANKSSIILAIIERQLAWHRKTLQETKCTVDLRSKICELFDLWSNRDASISSSVLYLEMIAESSRDKDVSEALAKSDKMFREVFTFWIKRIAKENGGTISDKGAELRALALQCLIEGLAVRSVRAPKAESSEIRQIVNAYFDLIQKSE